MEKNLTSINHKNCPKSLLWVLKPLLSKTVLYFWPLLQPCNGRLQLRSCGFILHPKQSLNQYCEMSFQSEEASCHPGVKFQHRKKWSKPTLFFEQSLNLWRLYHWKYLKIQSNTWEYNSLIYSWCLVSNLSHCCLDTLGKTKLEWKKIKSDLI